VGARAKRLLDQIIHHRAGDNEAKLHFERARLVMKGIKPAEITENSKDDPKVVEKLEAIAREMGLEPTN